MEGGDRDALKRQDPVGLAGAMRPHRESSRHQGSAQDELVLGDSFPRLLHGNFL